MGNGLALTSSIATSTTSYDVFSFQALGGDVKATLVWTDPAGTTQFGNGLDNPASVLVNDLDLKIDTSPTFHPWSLDINNPANAATRTGLNNVDNVEQVLIDSALGQLTAGTNFTVTVSHSGTLTGTQNYALLVSGAIVPEPGSGILMMIAGAFLLGSNRRRCRR